MMILGRAGNQIWTLLRHGNRVAIPLSLKKYLGDGIE